MTEDYQITDGRLTISNGTTYIRSQQFAGREDITSVVIPVGVGMMEEECFTECVNLRQCSLPEGLINIGGAAFAGCVELASVNIPDSVRSIDCGAFFSCEKIREIQLPAKLESIGEYSFQNSGIERVCVPATVKEIGDCAFFSCESLVRADVLGPNTRLGTDCFGSSYKLVEGYIAPGYPEGADLAAELLYTLLWCSCPERHGEEISERAKKYIAGHEDIVLERIIKSDNVPAMNGLAQLGLLSPEILNKYIQKALESDRTELTALLLKAKNAAALAEGEFEL